MDFIQDLGHLALGSRLKRLSDRIMSDGAEVYREAGLEFEPRWFPLFRLLADRGPMSVGEAASALGLTHAAISQTANVMTKQKIIAAKKDRGDERRRVLSLTELGMEILPKIQPLWTDIESAVREVVDYGGVDVLAAIDGIEHAMEREKLSERCARLRRRRELEEVSIVDYQPRYAADFRRLNEDWLRKYFTIEPVDVEIFENCQRILDDGGKILFAKIGGEVVGTCALFKQGDTYELAKMAVEERWRGKHIGKKLLQTAIERARKLKARSVFLMTNSSLVPAVSLYRSVGFRVTHSGPHPKYARSDLTMQLDL